MTDFVDPVTKLMYNETVEKISEYKLRSFFLNVLFRLPFDERTPIGYAVAGLIHAGVFFITGFVVTCGEGLIISFFLINMSFTI